MGSQHLELCMTVADEMRKTYFGAELVYQVFTGAQKRIRSQIVTGNAIQSPVPRPLGSQVSDEDYEVPELAIETDILSLSWYPFTGLDDFFSWHSSTSTTH